MATPTYQGPGQPLATNGSGLLGRLGSLFGGGATPRYLGDGQPSSSGGFFDGSTPAYLPAPDLEPTPSQDPSTTCASCPIDPAAIAAGNIAIVIPRDRGGTGRDEVTASD